MTELRIKLDNDPSKAEEIAALEKIQKFFFDKDTYLKSLFTVGLVNWVSVKIKDDIGPDLYGWFKGDTENFNQTLIQRDKAKELLARKTTTVAELESEIGILKEDRLNFHDECIRLTKGMDDYIDRNNELGQIIIELKAELYDLMTQGKEKEDD